jgi:phosphate transport system protein
MGEQSSRLFREASEAYLLRDPVRAAALSDMDDMLDSLQREFVAGLFVTQEPDAFDLSTAVQLAVLARFYERIGDHAVTIGERVRYLVTGAITHRRE